MNGRGAIAAVLVMSVWCLFVAVLEIAAPHRVHAFYGVTVNALGDVTRVFAKELPPGTHIAVGDHRMETPEGDFLRGYQLRIPRAGDTIHIMTSGGLVTITAAPNVYVQGEALSETVRQLAAAIAILCAALLFVRRPGVMAFGFWLWAISALGGGDLDYAIDFFPRELAFWVSNIFSATVYSGFALVLFALRFPSGIAEPAWRWLEQFVWVLLGLTFLYELIQGFMYFAGYWPFAKQDLLFAALSILPAAAVFVWRQIRAAPVERSRLTWATWAFAGAAIARCAGYAISATSSSHDWRPVVLLSTLLPLLAIYPILGRRFAGVPEPQPDQLANESMYSRSR